MIPKSPEYVRGWNDAVADLLERDFIDATAWRANILLPPATAEAVDKHLSDAREAVESFSESTSGCFYEAAIRSLLLALETVVASNGEKARRE